MENILIGLTIGLLIGGGLMYYFYAQIKAELTKVQDDAAQLRTKL